MVDPMDPDYVLCHPDTRRIYLRSGDLLYNGRRIEAIGCEGTVITSDVRRGGFQVLHLEKFLVAMESAK